MKSVLKHFGVLLFPGDIPYRYMLDNIKNASFVDSELKKKL